MIRIIMLGAGLVVVVLLFTWLLSAPSPHLAFEQTARAFSQARAAEAERYAQESFHEAQHRWQEARQAWKRENQRWYFLREFNAVENAAVVAGTLAQRATRQAQAARDSMQWLAAAGISLVRGKIDAFKTQFDHMPVANKLRRDFLAGELAAMESERAFQRRDYLLAVTRIQTAASYVGGAGEEAAKSLQKYLANIPQWQEWANETIACSKEENAVAFVVDKMAGRLQVYNAGELEATYPIELGPRWMGHKKQKGDGATPEGRYLVTAKKAGKLTVYYKALEIDYPNEEDQKNFQAARVRGELPANSHIGGMIEIHGEGGQGVNWTQGCVALRNKDMDKVFELAKEGTPVTIVGALNGRAPFDSAASRALAKTNRNGQIKTRSQ